MGTVSMRTLRTGRAARAHEQQQARAAAASLCASHLCLLMMDATIVPSRVYSEGVMKVEKMMRSMDARISLTSAAISA